MLRKVEIYADGILIDNFSSWKTNNELLKDCFLRSKLTGIITIFRIPNEKIQSRIIQRRLISITYENGRKIIGNSGLPSHEIIKAFEKNAVIETLESDPLESIMEVY